MNKPFSGFLEPHNFFLRNLESSNFLARCEYIERKTPSKNILEFPKHFSSRSHHKLFIGPPCIYIKLNKNSHCVILKESIINHIESIPPILEQPRLVFPLIWKFHIRLKVKNSLHTQHKFFTFNNHLSNSPNQIWVKNIY